MNKIIKLLILGSLLFVSGCDGSATEIDPTERLVFPTSYKEFGTMRFGELEAMLLTKDEFSNLLDKIIKATEETYIGYDEIRDEYCTYDPYEFSYEYRYRDEYRADQYTNGDTIHTEYRTYLVKDGNFYGTTDNYDVDDYSIYDGEKAITHSKSSYEIEYWSLHNHTDDYYEDKFMNMIYYNFKLYGSERYTFTRGDYRYLVLEHTEFGSDDRYNIYGDIYDFKAKYSELFVLELDKDYRMLTSYYESITLIDHDNVFGTALNEWVFDTGNLRLITLRHGERKAFDKYDEIKGKLPESYLTQRYHEGFYRDVYFNDAHDIVSYGDKSQLYANNFGSTKDNNTEYRTCIFSRQDSVNRAYRFELTRAYTNFKNPTQENLLIKDDLTQKVAELFEFPLITIENEQYLVVSPGSTEFFAFEVLYSRFGAGLLTVQKSTPLASISIL